MNEITAHAETKYELCGLTFEDMELICIGLDTIGDNRAKTIIKAIEKVLPEVDKEVDKDE